ncbi:MAG: hypothetical protein KGH69_05135 [Candidatus Micrarchaeota archaeon]|nr:hypothetical protein [Candidatus Micrarchaeota archaeon]
MSENNKGLLMSSSFWLPDNGNPIRELAIGCMDYRFCSEFTALQEGHGVVAYRNAGALLPDMYSEIEILLRQHDISKVSVYTHSDCGAVSFVYKVFQGEIAPSGEVEARLVRHFEDSIRAIGKDPADLTLKELEQHNADTKYKELLPFKSIFSNLSIARAPLADLSGFVKQGTNGAVVLFSSPTNAYTHEGIARMALGDEADSKKVYLVQRPSIMSALTDIEVAHALGIKDLRIVSLGTSQNDHVEGNVRMLMGSRKPFLGDMSVSCVPFRDVELAGMARREQRAKVR